MIFRWLKQRRRRKLLASPMPSHLAERIGALPFVAALDSAEQERLAGIARIIVHEKRWEGCAGLDLTGGMRAVIAAQAALLILNLEHDYYRRVHEILVYPATYQPPDGGARLGEAWYRGPVVLSWAQAYGDAQMPDDGHNVVFHEFAHKLDMLDGVVDGTPPLASRHDYPRWTRVMTEAFEELKTLARKRRRSVLDAYGATNEAEFFAVATETFFEKPLPLSRKLPELYELLRDYYLQDPVERLRRTSS